MGRVLSMEWKGEGAGVVVSVLCVVWMGRWVKGV